MNWTVDYGQGRRPITLPHAWNQDVPVTWEGPATYETTLPANDQKTWLVIHGASYQAKVFLNNEPVTTHQGIWDAFSFPIPPSQTDTKVKIEVTKNGGPTFPVREVLSGFIPYVFQTFGGLFRPVELIESEEDPLIPKEKPNQIISINNSNLNINHHPFFMRGVLTWGWYPELGHPHPDLETCREECQKAKQLGFNTIKFCLWLPPHHFFQALEENDLYAWIELPLWDPTDDPEKLQQQKEEIKRIVLQYRHHDRIIAWTVGCELHATTPPEFRQELVEFIQQETGCPLVKDNSGGAEMYGGDLREYGTFDDFHPYCDTPFYRPVLESLRSGPRDQKPILLGEFNDYDHTRDLLKLKSQNPYWISQDPDLNAQGVRWQHDFPDLLAEKIPDLDYAKLHRFSISKGHFIRKKVHEAVRQTPEIAGYVMTGWRDTPISTSGMVDDNLELRYQNQHVKSWNQPIHLGLLPDRCPPWINGGNRPGWRDTQNHFEGTVHLKITAHSELPIQGALRWRIEGQTEETKPVTINPLEPTVVTEINIPLTSGKHLLTAELLNAQQEILHQENWPIFVHAKLQKEDLEIWSIEDPEMRLAPLTTTLDPSPKPHLISTKHPQTTTFSSLERFLILRNGSLQVPFWRECVFEYLSHFPPFANQWEQLFPVSSDTVLTPQDLEPFEKVTPLMIRIDTRTYEQSTVVAAVEMKGAKGIITTLRPWGGMGAQPPDFARNPAGHRLLRDLVALANNSKIWE